MVPKAIVRTVIIVIAAMLVMVLEMHLNVAITVIFGAPLYLWTLLAITLIWLVGMSQLLFFYVARNYILRKDGIEVRRGIIRLHSFTVTPSGFGDLLLYQGLGGRIFGYGDLTVTSQGGRITKLPYVRSPYRAAKIIRDIMSKPPSA